MYRHDHSSATQYQVITIIIFIEGHLKVLHLIIIHSTKKLL